jgi:uncharacterized membrane protein
MLLPKIKAALGQLLFAANIFIIVLVLAESRLHIPDWLHVFGRLHPLLLHFPIVLLLLAVVLLAIPGMIKDREEARRYGANLLLFGTFTAAFTVIAGLLLSHEEGYEREALVWHKWTGLAVLWMASLLYLFLEKVKGKTLRVGSGILGLAIVVSGHLGAGITHGEDFLTGPLGRESGINVSLEEAEVFAHVVKPILQSKCVSCHKASKQKGELRLDAPQHIQKGGESGPVLERGNPEKSLMIQRIHLPMEDEEHMPPKGKPQLTEQEKAILEAWVESGADYEKKVLAYVDTTSMFRLAVEKFTSKPKTYPFRAADPKTISGLNNFYRKVEPLGASSPALSVSYFGRSVFNPGSLAELKGIYAQTVSLNLNNMPLEDEDLSYLRPFENLERLYLNFSMVRGEGLKELSEMENLRLLSLSGNPLDGSAVENLSQLRNLKQLYLWNTGLDKASIEKLREVFPGIHIEMGYQGELVLN